jgi:quinol monooxygenase YgiN
MSKTIYWVIALEILPGQTTPFQEIAAKLIESTRSESGTLAYEWALSENGETCHIFERYVDSAAVKIHLERSAKLVGQLFAVSSPLSFVIYGSPDDEVKRLLADAHPVYMQPIGGFSR